ncbi:CLIP domain-containing serine protease B9-like isoform X2 [Homarus americanus]|uniref:CLIP domain-containing serine protease B9-like isoform X2 n=1 Tax=Homarus americanus TaxID=6706 RepID=UPI001C457053|nr:CLIP domain-containing serine protease B9-like isoform X2 [Homarus americanus]
MCPEMKRGAFLLVVLQILAKTSGFLIQNSDAPQILRSTTPSPLTLTPDIHKNYTTPDLGSVGQPPNETGSHPPVTAQKARPVSDRQTLERRVLDERSLTRQASNIPTLEREPRTKKMALLRPQLWRTLGRQVTSAKKNVKRSKPMRKKLDAACGKTYTVTRKVRYNVALDGSQSCNVIFRAAERSAFKVVCRGVLVSDCSRAQLHLSSNSGTRQYCDMTTAIDVQQKELTELLLSYKVLDNTNTTSLETPATCSIIRTQGPGYAAEGQQVCPLSCGTTTADAEAGNPPPNYSSLGLGTNGIPLNTRIQGGKDANIGEWPWQVYLRINLDGSYLFCAGTILSPRYVMTAAHCVYDLVLQKGDRIRVVAYEYDLSKKRDTPKQMVLVKEMFVHSDYDPDTQTADVAVLKMKKSLRVGEGVAPVCLAPPRDYEGFSVVLLGWGTLMYNGKSSKKLKEATQVVTNLHECARNYSTLSKNHKYPVTADHLCTAAPGVDTCQGDSGGPILTRIGTTWYQVGIVSFGYKCAQPAFPGVSTFVPSYISWILSTMSGDACD